MPGLDGNEKITCGNCGTQTTKKKFVRHTTRCSAGTLHCTQCNNFPTTSQADLNYHITKKHATPRVKKHTIVKFVSKIFLAFTRCGNTKQASMEIR